MSTLQEQLSSLAALPMVRTALIREAEPAWETRVQFTCPEDVMPVLEAFFADKDREYFVVLMLNQNNQLIAFSTVSIGSLSASIVDPKQVFKVALLANAAAIICAHNHPSGNPEPSRDDLRLTGQLAEAGRLLGLPLHDHIICAQGASRGFTSLAERGLIH